MRRKKIQFILLLIIFFGSIVGVSQCSVDGTSNDTIKIMTYNIQHGGDDNLDPNWKDVVKSENPDIILFVETDEWNTNNQEKIKTVMEEFNSFFSSESPYVGRTTEKAILSRYPIVNWVSVTEVVLDNGDTYEPWHDFVDGTVNINGQYVHFIGAHLKSKDGLTNENMRERAQEGIINYMDELGDVPIIYLGDLNSISPEHAGDLGYGPVKMLISPNDTIYGQYASTVHTWIDVYRSLHPNETGGATYPSYGSRIDFAFLNQHFSNYLISSEVITSDAAYHASDHLPLVFTLDASEITGDSTGALSYGFSFGIGLLCLVVISITVPKKSFKS